MNYDVVVLAGGLGTRLRRVSGHTPKAMVDVAGRPFLEHLIGSLGEQGVRRIVLCVGYRRSQILRHFNRGRRWNVRLEYSNDGPNLLGTGGAVRNALPLLTGSDVVVLNGDTLISVNVAEIVAFHRGHEATATLAVAPVRSFGRYDAYAVSANGRILQFRPRGTIPTAGFLAAAGAVVLKRRLVQSLRIPSSLEETLQSLVSGGQVYGFQVKGFIDIGTPDAYLKAQKRALRHLRV